jgi:hypothetical protein
MNAKNLMVVICLSVLSLLLVSCGLGQILEPTPTPMPTATPTETPIPGGIITGRVYLLDRDEPVGTTVTLNRGFAGQVVDSTETDENGRYSFGSTTESVHSDQSRYEYG